MLELAIGTGRVALPPAERGGRPTASAMSPGCWPFAMRYLWPHRIDQLAEQAGLRLEARYADWHRRPFDAASTDHVSVHRL